MINTYEKSIPSGDNITEAILLYYIDIANINLYLCYFYGRLNYFLLKTNSIKYKVIIVVLKVVINYYYKLITTYHRIMIINSWYKQCIG